MFAPLSFLKSLFASKQSKFEELLESIYPIRIITKDESTDEITRMTFDGITFDEEAIKYLNANAKIYADLM